MKDLSFESSRPICFFDSGIGGLTLLGECVKRIPHGNFIYFADNGNVPYGNLPKEKIRSLADNVFMEISKYNPAAAVIACNTVTAECAAHLREKYSFPIIGIQPAIKPAAKTAEHCIVLATPATAHSASVAELVNHFGNGVTEVVECPDLAAYIEKNIFNLNGEDVTARLPDLKADAVVLGCTHYVYIEKTVKDFYRCPVYDGMEGTAKHLCAVLGNCDHFEADLTATENNSNHFSDSFKPKISFIGGDAGKNERIFNSIIMG